MKGKSLFLAIATFAIVLVGGAAMAGIGSYWSGDDATTATYASAGSSALEQEEPAEKPTTTLAPEKDVKAETPAEEPAEKPKAEEAKDKEVAEETKEEEPAEEPAKEPVATDPLFTLKNPEDGAKFKKAVVSFGGAALDGVTVHRGKFAAESKNGEWSMQLVLAPGKNTVTFEAIDLSGNTLKKSVTVYFDAPKEETKPDKSPFVAYQKYGVCELETPYDIFYGKAAPGAKITVSSAYGSGSTVANEKGKWELKVVFASAPKDKTFKVKVKASTGQSQSFSFSWQPSG